MTSSITTIADAWWVQDFACTADELRPTRTRVQLHAGALLGNPGIWILVAGGAPLVSLPSDSTPGLVALAEAWSAADVADAAQLQQQVASSGARPVERIVGPAFIGYGSADSLDLHDARLAQPFSSPTEVEALRAACPAEEWAHGGSNASTYRTFGVVDPANQLLALAGYEVWNESIAHISIVTHPRHRGRNFGRAAVALAAQHALATGLVPQYRTLRQNNSSMTLARRLGFVEYGFSVYVRLRTR